MVLNLCLILVALFLHDKDRLMSSILDEFIFDIFEHHVKSILHIVFSSSRHFFDDFGPFVSNTKPLFKDENIFCKAEWVFLDFRIQKVNPSLSALLTVSINGEILIQLVGNLTPLLCSIFSDEPDKLFIFSLDPIAFLYRRLLILVEFVLTLGVISPRDESSDLHPVILVKPLWSNSFTTAVFLDGPLEQLGFIICPILFGVISLLALQFGELIEYLRCLLVIYGLNLFLIVFFHAIVFSHCVFGVFLLRSQLNHGL